MKNCNFQGHIHMPNLLGNFSPVIDWVFTYRYNRKQAIILGHIGGKTSIHRR